VIILNSKYNIRDRFRINKTIYVICDIKFDERKKKFFYLVDTGIFGFYESQLKDYYFFEKYNFKSKLFR